MKVLLYLVYDRVAMVFNAPFPATNDGVAIRMFKAQCKTPDTALISSDLDLFKLGELDLKTGEVTLCEKPEFLYRNEVNTDG